MAFKIDPARFKLAAAYCIKTLGGIPRPRAWLRAPIAQGFALSVVLAGALYAWLAIEARSTLQALEVQTPPVEAAFEIKPQPAPVEQAATVPAVPDPAAGAIPALIEQTAGGPLPRIGADGTEPWRAYAQAAPAASGERPRIAILVNGLGLSASLDEQAIHRLPGGVSLGLLPFAERLVAMIAEARAAGHEIVLNAPMEPDQYPADDPGPQTLTIKASAAENVSRLDWHLARGAGYVGIAPSMGSKFTASPEPLRPVLAELAQRGLLYVDTGSAAFGAAPALARTIGVPIVIADRAIDRVPGRAAIDRELSELEAIARRKGSALGIASPYPVTLDRLAVWIASLDAKGIILVPVTAIAQAPAPAVHAVAERAGG